MIGLELLGHGTEDLRRRLSTITIDGNGGLEAYALEDCERFMRTVAMIPPGPQKLLEIGANPYFISLLMRWCRPDVDVVHTNFFGHRGRFHQEVTVEGLSGDTEYHVFEYHGVNIEEDELPEAPFSCVLFCEVLEHMTNDPLKPMIEISKALEPGGTLILTTPNVSRLENVARLMGGHNLYDPYSGFGPYGRHNREYTKHELWLLLQHCGLTPEILDTHDVHENRAREYFSNIDNIRHELDFRAADLGQYHFTLSRKTGKPSEKRPGWLFRSYPTEAMSS